MAKSNFQNRLTYFCKIPTNYIWTEENLLNLTPNKGKIRKIKKSKRIFFPMQI